jgi:hypothetical protein
MYGLLIFNPILVNNILVISTYKKFILNIIMYTCLLKVKNQNFIVVIFFINYVIGIHIIIHCIMFI